MCVFVTGFAKAKVPLCVEPPAMPILPLMADTVQTFRQLAWKTDPSEKRRWLKLVNE